MAFVVRTERGLETKIIPQQDVGPGSYIGHNEYQINKINAPFLTKGNRSQLNDEKNKVPGPGSYNYQDYGDGQKVVLQSGNSDVRVLEIPKQQSIFKSQSRRFQTKEHEVPGPGAYDDRTLEQKNSDKTNSVFKQNSTTIIDHLMKINRYQSIPSIPSQSQVYGYTELNDNQLELNKNTNINFTGLNGDHVGPGQYNIQDTFIAGKDKGPAWHKSKVPKLISHIPKDQEQVGPGVYNIDAQQNLIYKLKPSCGFASKSQRLFDNYKGTISQEFVKERQRRLQKQFKPNGDIVDDESQELEFVDDQTPGPGHYFNTINSLSTTTTQINQRMPRYKPDQSYAFGSQEQRFKAQIKYHNIGPGDYEEQKLSQSKIISHKYPPFQSSDTRFQVKIPDQIPGPQHYINKQNIQDQLLHKLQRAPLGNFGYNVSRFPKSSSIQNNNLGPGLYMDNIIENKFDQQDPSANFKSKLIRDPFKPQKDKIPPPGAYNIENLNIEKNVYVETEEDPDLMTKRAPFNTSVPRFESNKNDSIPEEEEENKTTKREINDLFIPKPKKNAPFNIQKPRFDYKSKQEKSPGPQDYFDPKLNKWSKKTFNILFAEI